MPSGDYRVRGYADLSLDHALSPEEPSAYGTDDEGSTLFHLGVGETVHVSILVREEGSIVTGRVANGTGAGIADASVTLIDRFGWALHGQSSFDGSFLIADAPTGTDHDLHYRFRVTAPGYLPLDTPLSYAVTRGTYDAGTLTLTEVPPAPDEVAPTVVSHAPTGSNVPVTTPIVVTFSEAMDKLSVAEALSISPEIPLSTLSWVGDTLTVDPIEPLAYATTYRVTIGASASDLAGNGLASSHAWSFTTAREATPPLVLEHYPVGDKVPPGKPIVIVFSEAMDRASVESGIHVSPGLYEETKTWWEGNTFYLRGHRAMDHGTTYTVTLDASIQDAQGDALGGPYSWTFTTAPGHKGDPGDKPTPPGHEPKPPNHGGPKDDTPKGPKDDTPKAPKDDTPKAPNPKEPGKSRPETPAPAKGNAPPKANAPKAELPKAHPPKADTPKADPPKADPPKADPPKGAPTKQHEPQGRSTDPVSPPGLVKHGKDTSNDHAQGRSTLPQSPPGQVKAESPERKADDPKDGGSAVASEKKEVANEASKSEPKAKMEHTAPAKAAAKAAAGPAEKAKDAGAEKGQTQKGDQASPAAKVEKASAHASAGSPAKGGPAGAAKKTK